MQRRKFLIGTGALAAGSAAAIGTGAFTSVQADRTVNVEVAGDDGAYLKIVPTDAPNSKFVSEKDNGELEIAIGDLGDEFGDTDKHAFDADAQPGDGVNPNARTTIESAFKIINQGTQEVEVDLLDTDDEDKVEVGEPNNPGQTKAWFYFDTDEGPDYNDPTDVQRFHTGTDAELEEGEAIDVDITIISGGQDDDLTGGTLTIEADADDAGENTDADSANDKPD
jgi:hypothetical protein